MFVTLKKVFIWVLCPDAAFYAFMIALVILFGAVIVDSESIAKIGACLVALGSAHIIIGIVLDSIGYKYQFYSYLSLSEEDG